MMYVIPIKMETATKNFFRENLSAKDPNKIPEIAAVQVREAITAPISTEYSIKSPGPQIISAKCGRFTIMLEIVMARNALIKKRGQRDTDGEELFSFNFP